MGFAFTRSTWREIVQCSKHFCTYDDYNWDWTIQFVSDRCLRRRLFAMVPTQPRAFHIGEWFVFHVSFKSIRFQLLIVYDISLFFSGLHHDSGNCDPIHFVTKIHQIFRKANKSHRFYPTNLELIPATFIKAPTSFRSNGGWSDIRDHNLCLSFSRENQ